jgi:hypothetical protein
MAAPSGCRHFKRLGGSDIREQAELHDMYSIKARSLRDQLSDRYRVVFLLVLVALLVGIYFLVAGPIGHAALIGGIGGMMPSLYLGTPARMRIDGSADRSIIDGYLSRQSYRKGPRGWVPKLPRALYFDSQIVRCDGHDVLGPVMVLRRLQRLLRDMRLQP